MASEPIYFYPFTGGCQNIISILQRRNGPIEVSYHLTMYNVLIIRGDIVPTPDSFPAPDDTEQGCHWYQYDDEPIDLYLSSVKMRSDFYLDQLQRISRTPGETIVVSTGPGPLDTVEESKETRIKQLSRLRRIFNY